MILHLIETGGPGGAEQMLLRLAAEYSKRGMEQLVCLRKEGWLADEVRRRGFSLEVIPVGSLPDLGWILELVKLTRRYGIRGIHSHEFAMNIRGTLLSKVSCLPCVATVHGKTYYADKPSRRLAYQFVSKYAKLVAVSEDIGDFLVKFVNVSRDRLTVIPNGIDLDTYDFSLEERLAMRQNLGIQEDQFLIGAIGSYYPVKGHRFLLDAMVKVIKKEPRARLVVAGQGPLEKELLRQASNCGIEDKILITGYVDDTPALLSALDIFVMPSLSEGQPLALIEAAANGRCIVATAVGGIPEIITDGVNGILIPPGNVDDLADVLVMLLRDFPVREHLAASAVESARRFSVKRAADSYLSLLFG
ncbi:glycosyltransferase [Geomonas azotofigens]|uniref:glycosyltransferase n=1 Tax=Geomonas azotofigens TaxID=2843196 RepID=UPI001C10BA3F|nr:glycosyltransferase [Geomonas azotofigens]MBU5613500.1 glycosyltransferase [Geomonas azotofigens]